MPQFQSKPRPYFAASFWPSILFWICGAAFTAATQFECVTAQTISTESSETDAEPLEYIGILKDKKITESSGLARARATAGCFWTMNDSGNGNDLFLFDEKGKTRAVCEVLHARNVDWESLATCEIDGRNCILIADTGDNLRRRKNAQLYCAFEPKCKLDESKICKKEMVAVKIDFTFEGGPVNCEAMGYDATSGNVYFIEKQFAEREINAAPKIYRMKLPRKTLAELLRKKSKKKARAVKQTLTAKPIAELPVHGVTGMAFSPDGQKAVVRTYLNFHLYTRSVDLGDAPSDNLDSATKIDSDWDHVFRTEKPKLLPLPLQAQGEAICFTANSANVIVTSEKARQAIWRINIEALQKQMASEDK